MKTLNLCICFLLLTLIGKSQPQWISFSSDRPSKPKVTLINSTPDKIIYDVQIPGMNMEKISGNGEEFQRLSFLGGQKWGDPGYPEIPSLGKMLAIPENNGMNITITIGDSLVLDGYNVYPMPDMVLDSSNGEPQLVEEFVKNDSIYKLDQAFPSVLYKSENGGYLRSQKVLKMSAFPIRYNPARQRLTVYTKFEVTIEFQNPQTSVTVNNGLFNRLSTSTLLNFTDQAAPPTLQYPNPTPGTVTWMTITDPSQADNIVADYLIITDDHFFTPHNTSLLTLANHRASYNGFDVVIVSVQNILQNSFAYDPPSNPDWVSERKIRTFIKQVYDGQHAAHTYDGRVGYICLVGHANIDSDDTGMPTSWDPDPTCYPPLPNNTWSPNDYYFTCVTKNPVTNDWDKFGDIFIGRLSARTPTDLANIVSKTIHNENEYSFENWKYINSLAYGGDFAGADPVISRNYFTNDLPNWLNSIYTPVYSTNMIVEDINGGGTQTHFNDLYVNSMNTLGSNIVFHLGHGETDSWCDQGNCYTTYSGALTLQYKIDNLTNLGKYPFVISQSCHTGAFAGVLGGPDCMATKTVEYSPTAGYVGYFGSAEETGWNVTLPGEFPKSLQERILGAIYIDNSSIIGEAVLEARIGGLDPNIITSGEVHFQYNLFADPAYNIMSAGYEITHNTTLPSPPPTPQTITISTKVYVRPGVTLTLSANAVMEFGENGQLIVENGATLELGNNVTIKGQNAINKITIEGCLTGPGGTITHPVVITNLHLSAINGTTWNGIVFNNPALFVYFSSCTFSKCSISGSLLNLQAGTSCTFTYAPITLNQSGLHVDACTFVNSNVLLTNNNQSNTSAQIMNSTFTNSSADAIIRIEHYPSYSIMNSTITYDHGTGIDLYYNFSNGSHVIANNTIQKSGSSQDMSWGIKVYNSVADIQNNLITNNRYGVASVNQSQVRLMGNANATSDAQTQRIINNYQNQVRTSDNSFPYYFHNNIIKNSPSGSTYLVYYDPNQYPNPIGGGGTDNTGSKFDVKCNCFDNSNPTSQLYPLNSYLWSTWCPPSSSCSFMGLGLDQFDAANVMMDSANYEGAEFQFKNIINSYPGSTYALESAKRLIPLYKVSNQDFGTLKTYLDTAEGLHTDSSSIHLVYRLKNICDVEATAFPAAISWYENDILAPATLNDSVYSLIDLSDTYIQMQADSNLKSSVSNYTGALAQYKPHDLKEYVTRSNEWIKLLFTDKPFIEGGYGTYPISQEYVLKQNNPNPFKVSTQITYTLPANANVTIGVTNILGQQILEMNENVQVAGTHAVTLDFTGKPDGIYFISFIADHKEVSKIKAIKTN